MRLIDADALKSYLYKQPRRYVKSKDGDWQNEGYTCDDVFFAIDKQLTAVLDADPVKHGYWTNAGVNNECFWLMQCSVCRGLASQVAEHFVYGFCPHCGAKMDEEVLDDDR